jgi:hypothetical protein
MQTTVASPRKPAMQMSSVRVPELPVDGAGCYDGTPQIASLAEPFIDAHGMGPHAVAAALTGPALWE